jgi:hypothetical protein
MKSWFRSEDVLAVLLGLLVVALSLSTLAGTSLLSWVVGVKEWTDPAKAFDPVSLAATFAFLLGVMASA